MELGQRLKQARLEAGLSQRQLCGDVITRNMLSLIENGAAQPSMDTLRYLAGMLKKPIGYFLEEEAITSPNSSVLAAARAALEQRRWDLVLQALKDYDAPDPVFDWERNYLEALSRLYLAQQALADQKADYAQTLLDQAGVFGVYTPYYTPDTERRRLVLLYKARPDQAQKLEKQLPPDPDRTLLLAAARPDQAGQILDAEPADTPQWFELRGEAYLREKNYVAARTCFEKAPQTRTILEKLEFCCRELEDYKGAYFYACQLR